jgi:hypothetical protein
MLISINIRIGMRTPDYGPVSYFKIVFSVMTGFILVIFLVVFKAPQILLCNFKVRAGVQVMGARNNTRDWLDGG